MKLAKIKIARGILLIFTGFILFFSFSLGSPTVAGAGESLVPTYGSGPVDVRMYTDYFCVPCRAAEPQIEAALIALMDKSAIRVSFIDTPIHKETPMYAAYFLYILKANLPLFSIALNARSVLYEAASKNIKTNAALESFLTQKGLKFKPYATQPTFLALEKLIKEDGINSTPSCVIDDQKKKEKLRGGNNIIKGLKAIAAGKEKGQQKPADHKP